MEGDQAMSCPLGWDLEKIQVSNAGSSSTLESHLSSLPQILPSNFKTHILQNVCNAVM